MDLDDGKLLERILGIASALAAWVALVLAFFSNRTSKHALRLAQQDASRRIPRLVPYLIDSASTEVAEQSRVISVSLSLSNPSDSANSVGRAELAIKHVLRDHSVAQLLIPAVRSSDGVASESLAVPIRVEAHATVTGQLQFRITSALVQHTDVREYSLQLTDSQGVVVTLELGVLRETSARGQ